MTKQNHIPSYEEYVKVATSGGTADEILQGLKELFAPTLEAALEAEMNQHLGYEKYSFEGRNSGNSRNGSSEKTIKTSSGAATIHIPRDRNGDFEPDVIKKYQTNTNEVEEKIIALYGLGNSTRDIAQYIKELYRVDTSDVFISQVTDKVLPLVKEWQSRALNETYPFVFLDGIHFKVRDSGRIVSKCAYVVLAYDTYGHKEVLGIWIGAEEGAKFWMNVLTDLKNRGIRDIFFLCADGLSGLDKAVASLYPHAIFQRCIVHQVRNTAKYVSSSEMSMFCKDLRYVYTAPTQEAGMTTLEEMIERWPQYKKALSSWKTNWDVISPFFDYSPEIRKIMYTTNTIESLNRQYRKVTKTTSVFPHDQSLEKLLYLATENITKRWTKQLPNWGQIWLQLSELFPDRASV